MTQTHSYAFPFYCPCPNCSAIELIEDWVIVDAIERPDLIRKIVDGTLTQSQCRRCGKELPPPPGLEPLLVYVPGRPLLLSPVQPMTRDEVNKVWGKLVLWLREGVDDSWPEGRPTELWVVDRRSLPGLISGSVPHDGLSLAILEAFWDQRISPRHNPAVVRENYRRVLDGAVESREGIVKTAGGSGAVMRLAQGHLAQMLIERYKAFGQASDLDRALDLYEQLVADTAGGYDNRCGRLAGLGNALFLRFRREGDLDDLYGAISNLESAVDGAKVASDLATPSTNLGAALLQLFYRTGDGATLDRAVQALDKAVAETPATSPDRLLRLNNLGICLRQRYKLRGSAADGERGIEVLGEAVEQTPMGSPSLPARLVNLSQVLTDQYDRSRNCAALDRAIDHLTSAVEATEPESPQRPSRLMNLGLALQKRSRHDGPAESPSLNSPERSSGNSAGNSSGDSERSIEFLEAAARTGLAVDPDASVLSARAWAVDAFQRAAWPEVARANELAQHASDQLLERQAVRSGKETWLRETQGLASLACYALAKIGGETAMRHAVETLERGRARLLNEVLERDRIDIDQLQALAPDAHALYRRAVAELRMLEVTDPMEAGEADFAADAKAHRAAIARARADLASAIERIREIPRQEALLEKPDVGAVFDDLPACDPLVYLVTTSTGSLALLVARRAESGIQIEPFWADELTSDGLHAWLAQQSEEEVKAGYLRGQLGDRSSLEHALHGLLPLLGKHLLGRVAARLHRDAAQPASVVLIPVGLLSLLPLHAATFCRDGQPVDLLDGLDVAYAASARSMIAARARLAGRNSATPVLAGVANPLPNPKPLPFAALELNAIGALFSPENRHLLIEEQATVTAAGDRFQEASHIHLACHGSFAPESPMDSSLELANQDGLTLRTILSEEPFRTCRLVVLSACQTAISDFRNLPDESIGLPTGILHAGVPGVVGSLWSVNDLSTGLLMEHLYNLHLLGDSTEGPMSPQRALCRAQVWLRTASASSLAAHVRKLRKQVKKGSTQYRDWTAAWKHFKSFPKAHRPFEPPYYWAGFVLTGA